MWASVITLLTQIHTSQLPCTTSWESKPTTLVPNTSLYSFKTRHWWHITFQNSYNTAITAYKIPQWPGQRSFTHRRNNPTFSCPKYIMLKEVIFTIPMHIASVLKIYYTATISLTGVSDSVSLLQVGVHHRGALLTSIHQPCVLEGRCVLECCWRTSWCASMSPLQVNGCLAVHVEARKAGPPNPPCV